jgi:endogenous inhibitor of DNA gyrase (YacG/DUF329 family)
MTEATMPVTCPKCGTAFQKPLGEMAAGALVPCPSCGEQIKITGDAAATNSQIFGDLVRRVSGYGNDPESSD